MVASARLAMVVVGLLALFMSPTVGAKKHRPSPPGLDPDEDAAHRAKYQTGKSMWRPVYLKELRRLRGKWSKIAPVYFYRRTCGHGEPARQVVVRVGQFDFGRILRDDASQNTFLFYIRWLIELYWRHIVPVYRLEPKPVFIVDCSGLSWRTTLANSLGINAVIRKLNSAFHSVTGKGIGAVFILNAPYGFSSIWNTLTSLVPFRNDDVVIVQDDAGQQQLLKVAGARCLWEGHGGKSKVPLEDGTVEDAILRFSKADDVTLENPDAVRLTVAMENFPTVETPEELKQKLDEILSTETAISQTSTESG